MTSPSARPPTPNLATLRGAEHASTRRTYGRILRWIGTEFGSDSAPGIDPERFAAWFTAQWAGRSPSTWNVSLDAIRSAAAWWMQQGWITAGPARMLKRRKPRPDRARALSQAEVEQMITRENISLRERTLWRMLYETAARSAEVLALNVEPDDREILALPERFGPAGGLVSAGRAGQRGRGEAGTLALRAGLRHCRVGPLLA